LLFEMNGLLLRTRALCGGLSAKNAHTMPPSVSPVVERNVSTICVAILLLGSPNSPAGVATDAAAQL